MQDEMIASGDRAPMSSDALPIINRRYQLLDKIGFGDMGVVYRAYDRLNQQVIALKQVNLSAVSDADSPFMLAQEFRTLASLRHPNIISVLDYGFTRSDAAAPPQPYFTMDWLAEAEVIISAGQGLPPHMQVDLLIQMFYALAYLHRRGILHRDLKPANVVVVDGTVKVLDFGLSLMRGQATSSHNAGTLAYMAPELLQGAAASIASDLYAAGLIAYEMFAGQHPFDLHNVPQLMQQIVSAPVDTLSLDIDSGVARVIERLLAKTPEARYTNAHDVVVAMAVAVDKTLPRETSMIRESFLQVAKFVGRAQEMATLKNALENAVEQRKGSAWLIGGESGVGKSRLIAELHPHALVTGALVLRGQGMDKNHVPHEIWRDVLRQLTLYTELSDLEASVLKGFVPDITHLLQRPIATAPALDPQAAHERLLRVVRDVLHRCCQKQACVIILEDAHYADSEGLLLLQHLLDSVHELPLLLIASYRDDQAPDLPQTLAAMRLLTLERLQPNDIATLSESLLGEAGRQEQIVSLLRRETAGNVFFMVEVVRALAEDAGTLTNIGVKTLPEKVFAGGVSLVVRRRLERLPLWAQGLLQVAAAAGRQIDPRILQRLDPKIDIERWLTTCAESAVLDVQDNRWRFAHEKLREGVLDDLSEQRRKHLHGQVAWAIEHVYPDDPAQAALLAYHWSVLGDLEKIARYAQIAGEHALRSGANYAASRFFEQALDAINQLTFHPELQRRYIDIALAYGRAAAAFPSAKVIEALQQALQWTHDLHDEERQASILSSMGAFYYVSGRIDEAMAHFKRAIALAEQRNQDELLLMPYAMNARAALIAADFPYGAQLLTKALALAEKQQDAYWLSGTLAWQGMVLLQQSRSSEAIQHLGRSIMLAEGMHNPARLATVLLFVGAAYFYGGYYNEAVEILSRSLTLAQQVQSRVIICNAAGNLGCAWVELGNPELARHYLELALSLVPPTNALVAAPLFLAYRAELDLRIGDEQAVARAENALQLAEATHQVSIKVLVARILGRLCMRLAQPVWEKAEAYLQQSLAIARSSEMHPAIVGALLELGKLYAAQGKTQAAQTVLQEALSLCERAGPRHHLRALQEALYVSRQGQAQ
ncbi:MAG: protein kinase [Chloroflexi bacterium]|nr:protein kinase [Chloroflexota bacterium]